MLYIGSRYFFCHFKAPTICKAMPKNNIQLKRYSDVASHANQIN